MTDPTTAFAKMVPGFDFLQGLVKNAGAALPGVGQWIAPTLDPEELDKRISELRTVQYWLEQNARLLGASIQALEVQRMTLSTLKTMNVSMTDLTESLKIRMPEAAPEAPAPAPRSFFSPPAPAAAPTAAAASPAPAAPPAAAAPVSPPGVIDPMQWWGALSQQFTELATKALQDTSADPARNLAGTMVKQGLEAAGETLKTAAAMPMAVAQNAAEAARKMAAKAAPRAAAAPAAASPAAGRAATPKPARRPATKATGRRGAAKPR